MPTGWERVADADVVGSGETETSLTTGTFEQYKYLKILCYCNAQSSTTLKMQFNGDTTESYAAVDLRLEASDGARSTNDNTDASDSDNLVDNGTGDLYCTVDVVNEPTKEKQCYSKGLQTPDGAYRLALRDVAFKWIRTSGSGTGDSASYITKVTVNASTDCFDEFSSLIVFGANDITLVQPNLPNGTIFNETDTYKYFMWNGTDTWNQMVSS